MRFHTTRRYFDRLSHCQTAATVFALVWATCPTLFAVGRAKQEAKRIISREVSKLVTIEIGDSLLDQIMSLPFGDLANSVTASAQTIEVERPEGKYVFNNVSLDDGVASGSVTTYNLSGAQTGSFDVQRLSVGDSNRIDYAVHAVSPGVPGDARQAWNESGSLSGISGSPGTAVSIRSVDEESSAPVLVNYGALLAKAPNITASQGGVADDECPVTTSPLGGGGGSGGVATVAECAAVILIIVLFVAVTCFLFGWWGC